MKVPEGSDFAKSEQIGLPLQQWILLPAIGLMTILFLAVCTELTTRMLYPISRVGFDRCFVSDDLSGDAPARPDGVCVERVAESRFPVEYRFNSRGNRAGVELQPKPPGTYRIVMIGSSMAMGLFIPQPMSFAALLPTELSERTGRRIELYNEATGGKYRGGPFPTRNSVQHFGDVFAAQPDMILWVITPMDVENAAMETHPPVSEAVGADFKGTFGGSDASDKFRDALDNLGNRLRRRWEQTRTCVVLKHLLLKNESQDQYVNSYLKDEEDAAFLKTRPGARWQQAFEFLQNETQEFTRQANAAGVSFVVVLIPNRAQAAMISRGQWPQGYDPYKLGNMLRTSVERDRGTYIDILPDLRSIPNPEQHYFPVDGHLDVDGHAMIARLLVAKLASGTLLGTGSAAPQPQAALVQGR